MTDTPNTKIFERKTIAKLSAIGIGGNIALSAYKLVAGILGNSAAMVSDAVHSLSDVFATAIAYLGTRMSKRAADDTHPYGHERFECLASLVLGLILAVTGAAIGWGGIESIGSGVYLTKEPPSLIALSAAVVSICVKEAMFWYTRHYAKILKSDAFMADAWHHRSDALSSIGALLGIGGAILGFSICDPIACIVICLFILKVSFDILKDAVNKMLDVPCDTETANAIKAVIVETPGVERLDTFKTRLFGNKVYVDAEIAMDGGMTLNEAHAIAEAAHANVEAAFSEVKHIMIHVNPL